MLLCGGCNFFATKRISKTAAKRTSNCKDTTELWLTSLVVFILMQVMTMNTALGAFKAVAAASATAVQNDISDDVRIQNGIIYTRLQTSTVPVQATATEKTQTSNVPSSNSPLLLLPLPLRHSTLDNIRKSSKTIGNNDKILLSPMITNHNQTLRVRRKHPRSLHHSHSPHTPEWENPCNGRYEDSNSASISMRTRMEALRRLRGVLRFEFRKQFSRHTGVIDISDFNVWSKHYSVYRFLGRIRKHHMTLNRWHERMQIYVATFSYLKTKQREIDFRFQKSNEPLAHELNSLLQSSKRVLCEIETAINVSTSRRINVIKPDAMNNITSTLKTKSQGIHEMEVNPIDLIYAKSRYCSYLCESSRSIDRWIKDHKNTKARKASGKNAKNNETVNRNTSDDENESSNRINNNLSSSGSSSSLSHENSSRSSSHSINNNSISGSYENNSNRSRRQRNRKNSCKCGKRAKSIH